MAYHLYRIEARGKTHAWVLLGEQRVKRVAGEHAYMLAEELERETRVVEYTRDGEIEIAKFRPGMVEEVKRKLLKAEV